MSFRSFLDMLKDEGVLNIVDKEVSSELEAAEFMKNCGETPTLFNEVKGSSLRAAAGIFSSRELVAKALGIGSNEITQNLLYAAENHKTPRIVGSGACQEVVENEFDLNTLPIMKFLPKDGGRYITSAVVITKDTELGRNSCFHRLMLLDGKRFAARIVENRGTDSFLKRNGGELDVAICIGNSAAVLLSAATSLPKGSDELAMANALEKTDLVRCRTVDIEVPADCEIVLEGRITKEKENEGPFLDLTGTYDIVRKQPVIEIGCVTRRKDGIFQTLLPGGREHKILMGMPREPTIFREVNKVCPCKGVNITPGGCSWLHAVVSIDKKKGGDGKKAIEAAFRGHSSLKHCVVTDSDIDIYNTEDVEWAIATRFQADKGLIVLRNQGGSSLDPSSELSEDRKTKTAKMGLDATMPSGRNPKEFRKEN